MLSNTVAGGGVFVTYPQVSAAEAQVQVKTEVANTSGEDRVVTLVQTLKNGRSNAGSATLSVSLKAGETRTVEQALLVRRPRLWSPREPNLYTLETRVQDGRVRDVVETRIGIRRFEITKDTFKINGEPYRLRGVNRHQEYPYVGYALSPNADRRDALLMKQAGFDFVRLSHYPQSPAFMAAADELGLVLLDSIPGWQYMNSTPAFRDQVLRTCRDMIRRDRNHPSVVAWECSLNETGMPRSLVDAFHTAVHEEYPGDQAWSAGWMDEGYDIFIHARQHRQKEPWTKKDRPYIVSEYGDWEYYAQNAGFNQDSWADLKQEERTSRQALSDGEIRLLQQATNLQEAHNDNYTTPAFADGYWVMFDYNRGYADDLETSGVASLERLPKFSYFFFQSQRDASEASKTWGGGPMVHIASFWNAQSSPKVRIFSNAEEVELFLNGKSVGRRAPDRDALSTHLPHPPFTFDLGRFTPGKLEARAYIKGKVVARHVVETAGEPARVEVALDDMGVRPDARDLVFARARLVDASGRQVFASGVPVTFAASGGYEIVGPATATTEAGVASVLVRTVRPGGGKVTARRD
jgi:beta-galactosidase